VKVEDITHDGRKTFIRRGEAMEELGLTKYQLECMVESGSLKRVQLPGMAQSYFRSIEIIKIKKGMENGQDGND
jgi:hypothetical protein